MKNRKKRIKEALLEGMAELVLTVVFFGIGALILGLFGVKFDSPSIDGDLVVLLGFAAVIIIFIAVNAMIRRFKKSNKNRK